MSAVLFSGEIDGFSRLELANLIVLGRGLLILPRAAIVSILKGITGLKDVRFDITPQPYIDPTAQARLVLSVSSRQMLGWDEHRFSVTPTDQVDRLNGLRSFSLSVRCETFDTRDGSIQAGDYLETIRTLVYEDSPRALFHAANLAVAGDNGVRDLPLVYNQRLVSAAVLDLEMSWGVTAQTDAHGYVATANTPQGTFSLP